MKRSERPPASVTDLREVAGTIRLTDTIVQPIPPDWRTPKSMILAPRDELKHLRVSS
jgi:hypothetical protein